VSEETTVPVGGAVVVIAGAIVVGGGAVGVEVFGAVVPTGALGRFVAEVLEAELPADEVLGTEVPVAARVAGDVVEGVVTRAVDVEPAPAEEVEDEVWRIDPRAGVEEPQAIANAPAQAAGSTRVAKR